MSRKHSMISWRTAGWATSTKRRSSSTSISLDMEHRTPLAKSFSMELTRCSQSSRCSKLYPALRTPMFFLLWTALAREWIQQCGTPLKTSQRCLQKWLTNLLLRTASTRRQSLTASSRMCADHQLTSQPSPPPRCSTSSTSCSTKTRTTRWNCQPSCRLS